MNRTTIQRREAITNLLRQANEPIPAATLAAQTGVSRQIIVGDIALLRASGVAILATPRGYVLESGTPPLEVECRVVCQHSNERIREEMYTVVDLGGSLFDVTVEHPIYGEISAPLRVASRFDVDAFCDKIQTLDARPLCNLTSGIHLHTLRAANQVTLHRVIQALADKGFLVTE